MSSTKTFSVPVIRYVDYTIDFQKIYDYLHKKFPEDDIYMLGDYFGDNIEICLENVFNIKFPDEVDEELLDDIWHCFYDWLEENEEKLGK